MTVFASLLRAAAGASRCRIVAGSVAGPLFARRARFRPAPRRWGGAVVAER
ncbi:MAG: hypothetical protein GVY33_14865 [Alphaproteobacteria bacterium]|jgi:hypothetical protein|nr:hypothetical protein [Alphaproteobacteria bacterium]